MNDFNIKQKHSKFLIMCKELLFISTFLLFAVSFTYFVMFAIFWPNDWMINHWYFGIAGWLIIAFFTIVFVYMVLRLILYGIYMYVNHLSFQAYLPLDMDDLKNNHIINQADLVHFLVIYRIRKVKILSDKYNEVFKFNYCTKNIDTLKNLYSQLPPDKFMSKEFKAFYLEYLKKYGMESPIDDITYFVSVFNDEGKDE